MIPNPSDPLDYQKGDLDNCEGMNNGIPGGEWMEYDHAAEWCAARGLLGVYANALPEGLSSRARNSLTSTQKHSGGVCAKSPTSDQ